MTHADEFQAVVIYDACVLYPYTLRDTLISLTKTRRFQARWTNAINDEWTRNLLTSDPGISSEKLKRTCQLMNQAVPDAIVEGYEHIVDQLSLPDPDDRHVLAAAIHAEADKIITENVRDFPKEVISSWEIEVCRPDAFVSSLLKEHPTDVLRELKRQRLRLKNPPQSGDEFLNSFSRVGLTVTASMLRDVAEFI